MVTNIERNRVRSFIMDELINGNIDIGDRLSLPALSKKLKCSVTPIREALTQLEYSNVIKAIPNRGFVIPELNFNEATQLYALVSTLEAMALENSVFGIFEIKELIVRNKNFKNAKNSSTKIAADMDFHESLIKNYDNPFAQQAIRDLKIRIFFYEKSYMDNINLSQDSYLQHDKIIEAIKNNNLKQAARILKQNWMYTLGYILNTSKI